MNPAANPQSGLDRQATAAALSIAAKRARVSPFQKLLRPGIHKYALREFARRRKTATALDADLFFGGSMNVLLPDVISESIYLFGFFDEVVSTLALDAVRPGDCVLDVGAHFGYFSTLFSALVGPSGRVFSFEPTPSTFTVLASNAARLSNVTAVQAAAGAENGTCEIADYGLRLRAWNTIAIAGESRLAEADRSASSVLRTVAMRRIDDFVAEQRIVPNVVKIDAENFEEQVIAGMAETIRRHRPRIILEAGSNASLAAARQILSERYDVRVYAAVGEVIDWTEDIEKANAVAHDILFVPS